jgi:c-di-GMP-binding flagellar brake protein YcgR
MQGPAFLDTQPASIGTLNGDGLDEFRVGSPPEVLALLRNLADGSVLVNISAPDGSSYTSTVWAIDTAHRRISFSADLANPHVQRLVDAGEAVVVAYLDSVKLQFDLHHLMVVRGARECALQADLPRELFRFQRRASFRVRIPASTSPTAHLRHPSQPDLQLALRILDVSMGGCSVALPNDVAPLPLGVAIDPVRLELDADTRFAATLQVQHVTAINPNSGGSRLGCQLSRLTGDAQRALQRYIDQTQKRRRLLSLD